MNLLIRLGLLIGAMAVLLIATGRPQGESMQALVLSSSAGACLVGAVASQFQWRRPASDAVAWIGASGYLFSLNSIPEDRSRMLLLTVGIIILLVALHVPSVDAPRLSFRSSTITWMLATVMVTILAWWPFMQQDDGLSVLDPMTGAGIALRVTIGALVVGALSFLRKPDTMRSRATKGHETPD